MFETLEEGGEGGGREQEGWLLTDALYSAKQVMTAILV